MNVYIPNHVGMLFSSTDRKNVYLSDRMIHITLKIETYYNVFQREDLTIF